MERGSPAAAEKRQYAFGRSIDFTNVTGGPAIMGILIRIIALLGLLLPSVKSPTPRIVVGPNVHISAARATVAHDEVVIAVDPENPSSLLAAAKIYYQEAKHGPVIA